MNKYNCIFIHIPKTGGTSIRAALGAPKTGRMHLPWHVYYQANPVKFNKFKKIAFIRDPISRAYSAYTYLCRGGNHLNDLEAAELIKSYDGFADFVDKGLDEGFFIHHTLFIPQSYFVCDYAGRIKVDFLGRTETLNKDARAVFQSLGVTGVVNHVNASPENTVHHASIQPECLSTLENIYRTDFSLLSKVKIRENDD